MTYLDFSFPVLLWQLLNVLFFMGVLYFVYKLYVMSKRIYKKVVEEDLR
ncbi:hypothetical protein EV197_0362 [Aquimarina brevivitae]|uniref:Uncharacterized protein n=1 Tax=Aquimarina brevivitae TaxID=323412 RepID=A0A4Q7PFB8_9FLAO|nr:hypothetical protein EV197_0362 [Aquimarina brevivitae]